MSKIQKIRQAIVDKNYYLSSHAEEEMINDRLEQEDIEMLYLKEGSKRKLPTI